jgi:hypothetical protein
MPIRISMNLVNPQPNNFRSNVSNVPNSVVAHKNMSLNSPMIGRIHKAKSGCSACGKKVA